VFTGAITSAGTFYALCVTQFPGLRHFGFLVGSGILLRMVAILFLLPAMIAYVEGERVTRLAGLFAIALFPPLPLPLLRWWERRDRMLPRRSEEDASAVDPAETGDGRAAQRRRRLYLHSFGVERLLIVAGRRPATTAIASLLMCLVLGAFALDIELSENIKDMRSPQPRRHGPGDRPPIRRDAQLDDGPDHGRTLTMRCEEPDVAMRLDRLARRVRPGLRDAAQLHAPPGQRRVIPIWPGIRRALTSIGSSGRSDGARRERSGRLTATCGAPQIAASAEGSRCRTSRRNISVSSSPATTGRWRGVVTATYVFTPGRPIAAQAMVKSIKAESPSSADRGRARRSGDEAAVPRDAVWRRRGLLLVTLLLY
jgi:hypothetical protein